MADRTEHQKKTSGMKREEPPAAANAEKKMDAGSEAAHADAQQAKPGDHPQSGFANPAEFLSAELDRVESEKANLQDQLLRLAADMDNLRKRTQKEISDARNYAVANFAREMVTVADNLRRALDAVTEEARESADESFRALIEGVELTERSMLQALEKHGVRKVTPLGEKFDPNFHQAMFEIPNGDVPNQTVLEVVQDGYVINDRVLRPALVGVSRGGPKQPRGEEDDADQAAGDADHARAG